MNCSAVFCCPKPELRIPGLETCTAVCSGELAAIVEHPDSDRLQPGSMMQIDERAIVLDLGIGSTTLGEPLSNIPVERFARLVNQAMADAGTEFAFGR